MIFTQVPRHEFYRRKTTGYEPQDTSVTGPGPQQVSRLEKVIIKQNKPSTTGPGSDDGVQGKTVPKPDVAADAEYQGELKILESKTYRLPDGKEITEPTKSEFEQKMPEKGNISSWTRRAIEQLPQKHQAAVQKYVNQNCGGSWQQFYGRIIKYSEPDRPMPINIDVVKTDHTYKIPFHMKDGVIEVADLPGITGPDKPPPEPREKIKPINYGTARGFSANDSNPREYPPVGNVLISKLEEFLPQYAKQLDAVLYPGITPCRSFKTYDLISGKKDSKQVQEKWNKLMEGALKGIPKKLETMLKAAFENGCSNTAHSQKYLFKSFTVELGQSNYTIGGEDIKTIQARIPSDPTPENLEYIQVILRTAEGKERTYGGKEALEKLQQIQVSTNPKNIDGTQGEVKIMSLLDVYTRGKYEFEFNQKAAGTHKSALREAKYNAPKVLVSANNSLGWDYDNKTTVASLWESWHRENDYVPDTMIAMGKVDDTIDAATKDKIRPLKE